MLNEANLNKVDELIKRYPEPRAALLPVLWIAQEQEGFISEKMMKHVGNLLHLSYSHILGVVTFYTMFYDKPHGKYHIEVCTNISCMLRGSDKILSTVKNYCGVKVGETSLDGKFTISEVECMGACNGAPMIAIGEDYFENLNEEKTLELLNNLSNNKTVKFSKNGNGDDDDDEEFGGGD
ncbi:MAG: NAD(P)H-dependent oxidoreductase subunit E [Bacteroidetes bacterium]|nr:NAD(P)H-dependent oxidoreductase subunit E [Bacteroidota bacterium]